MTHPSILVALTSEKLRSHWLLMSSLSCHWLLLKSPPFARFPLAANALITVQWTEGRGLCSKTRRNIPCRILRSISETFDGISAIDVSTGIPNGLMSLKEFASSLNINAQLGGKWKLCQMEHLFQFCSNNNEINAFNVLISVIVAK